MSRRKVTPFTTSAKTKRQYKALANTAAGSVKAAGKTHKQLVKYRKARRAQVSANMRGTFLGRMPILALLIRLWTGHGCITKLILIPCFVFYLALLPVDLFIAVIASIFAR